MLQQTWRKRDEKVERIESSLADMGALDGSTVDTRRNLLPVRLAVLADQRSAVSASVERDIAIIDTRAIGCLKHSRILSRGSQDRSLCLSD